jgi:hypothetical protein
MMRNETEKRRNGESETWKKSQENAGSFSTPIPRFPDSPIPRFFMVRADG